MKIKVDKIELKQINKDFLSNTERLKKLIKEIESETSRVSKYWEEGSATTFFNVIHSHYIPKLNSYVETLNSYSEYLTNAVELYDQLETTFASKKIEV